MTDRQRNGFILLLVLGLLAASVAVIATHQTRLGLDLKGGVELVYQGTPTKQTPVVTQEALSRAVDIIRERVDQLGVAEPEIQTSGANQISVGLPNVKDFARAEKQVGTTAQLAFYDWEANAITPNGKTVAGQLAAQDATALTISQGSGAGPGSPGSGSMLLHDAVKLAAAQPEQSSPDNARLGSEYYYFGAPGSAACQTAAKAQGKTATPGIHCLLSGPDDNLADLTSGLPAGVTASDPGVEQLVIKPGTVVIQASDPTASHTTNFNDPTAQFYVLKDHVALFGTDISNPTQSTDSGGNPDVTFSFSGNGGNKFQDVTRTIAQRGQTVSGLGQTLSQHFAVALDRKLVTVPRIDFKQYPDGITGGQGADITGGFTIQSAQDLANLLRLGALPINLKLISESQVSATLGKQALHQGLIAGLVGLCVVAIFLLIFYRVLGVIAVAALIVYAIYFFALIKLIPITLTLPGIAGLILTIGVAADANIVIFERVKEEVRAGRSIRQSIITGYKKGLTAIIDANVVTIMTAFILFVLATSEVKGFAFTLGIGTIVSLFTAVLATQAILMTMGDSRIISSPATLGARGGRVWRYDFMGASRYFFTMSGVILLIGALAVGGRGLNLGIDFTSGTRIDVGLVQAASEAQVRSQLETKFGLAHGGQDFSSNSVGPTFGKTVANSAVVAIIASLLVISAYVALRFEWKFAVPVLIALMHDLLITAGVYALTGREVTTATVAALLTILGYSLYDTIIVFDRVRENIPRMPRAAFSQIVNRSMSEVLTRSIATTSCTLMPILALLLFGGATLKDFAFALLIGVASGAYSSIFIASPVLTHWKEREPGYRARRHRIEADQGFVPAYAGTAADVDPTPKRGRRVGRLTTPEPETVSAAEFEQMKRDVEIERRETAARGTSTRSITKRLAHTADVGEADAPAAGAATAGAAAKRTTAKGVAPKAAPKPAAPPAAKPDGQAAKPAPAAEPTHGGAAGDDGGVGHAPDVAENEGVAPVQKPKTQPKSKSRNRRHGRRR